MQEERWQRIGEIFHSALDIDEHSRSGFLDETCSGDADLRRDVERLLRHYAESDSFLECSAMEVAVSNGRAVHSALPREGEIVLHYRVGAKLGSGGMGVVYRGDDLKLGRGVALKFLHDYWTREPETMSRLEAEARAASSLNHPNICTVYAIEEYDGQPVLVLELLEGESLYQRLKAGPLGLEKVLALGTQACNALEAAHKKGITHRDVKPANIFLTSDDRLKLVDFGIAKWSGAGESNGERGEVAGTVLYMSPEQLRGNEIDGRSDLYSLGVVLYELATGTRPFDWSSAFRTIEAVLNDEPARPSSLNPNIPAAFDHLIGRMIEKDPGRRYSSAGDVADDLLRLSRPSKRMRPRWVAASVGAALALTVGLGAILWTNGHAPALTSKDTIVLAEFENKTGDPTFNDVPRQGLAVQLQQSPFLSLISEQRIRQVLLLMAKPADTPLRGETARDVCVRTQSAALLDGSIAKLGRQYVLWLRGEDCRTGNVLFSEQVQAKSKEDVLRAISQMAWRFRQRAGESMTTIEKHSTPLAEATTSSLEAWRAYAEAWRVGMLKGHAPAIAYLKRAVEIDPKFASAYAFLGRDYSALGEMEQARRYTTRAFEERNRANDQERFFIDYSYEREVTGDLDKVMETCELWTHMYPRDVLGHGLCGAAAKVLGRFDKVVEEENKAIEADPDHPYAYVHLISLALYRGNFPEARRWLQSASKRRFELPDFLMMRYLMAFLQGDRAEMEASGMASENESEIQDWIWGERAQVLGFSGRLREARAMSRRAVDVALSADRRESAAQHQAGAAVREALFGNSAVAKARALDAQRLSRGLDAQYGAALAFVFAGDLPRAQLLASDLEQKYPDNTLVKFNLLPTLRAVLELRRGHPNAALDLLGPATRYELAFLGCCSVGFVGSLYPIYARGEAFLALHQGPEAAAEFQKILDYRGLAGSNPIGILTHWQRGKALAMAARSAEAKAEYEYVLSLWQAADPDLPILRQVKAEYRQLLSKSV